MVIDPLRYMNNVISAFEGMNPSACSLLLSREYHALGGHRGFCPVYNDMIDERCRETQEVASYIFFPQEHHEETGSAHPIDEDTIRETRQ
jgi:hypothetical protein